MAQRSGVWIITQDLEDGEVAIWKATKSKPQLGKLVSSRENLGSKHLVLAVLPEQFNSFLDAIESLDKVPSSIGTYFQFSEPLDLIVSIAVKAGMTQKKLKDVNLLKVKGGSDAV